MSEFDRFPSVANPSEPEQPYWEFDDWAYVFGEGNGNSTLPEFFAASPDRTPVPPIGPDDVERVDGLWAIAYREYADQTMCAVMKLKDGRYASVETWSDSSGYGCRDGTDWFIGGYSDVIAWGLSDESRTRLGIDQPYGDHRSE